jgi:hypothetical protein
LVLKKNKTWRMCIDYTSLKKACPQGPLHATVHRPGDQLHSRL